MFWCIAAENHQWCNQGSLGVSGLSASDSLNLSRWPSWGWADLQQHLARISLFLQSHLDRGFLCCLSAAMDDLSSSSLHWRVECRLRSCLWQSLTRLPYFSLFLSKDSSNRSLHGTASSSVTPFLVSLTSERCLSSMLGELELTAQVYGQLRSPDVVLGLLLGFSAAPMKLTVSFMGFDLWHLGMRLSAVVLSTWLWRHRYRPSPRAS